MREHIGDTNGNESAILQFVYEIYAFNSIMTEPGIDECRLLGCDAL
jgi:hypothetical protein